MSRASEWAEEYRGLDHRRPTLTVMASRELLCVVSSIGDLVIESDPMVGSPWLYLQMQPGVAVALGQWLVNTFGEEDRA